MPFGNDFNHCTCRHPRKKTGLISQKVFTRDGSFQIALVLLMENMSLYRHHQTLAQNTSITRDASQLC